MRYRRGESAILASFAQLTLARQGAAAAVISQPGDTLLSQINKGEGGPGSATSKLIRLAKEAGFSGLFVGLGPRVLMTAGLVSGQFVLYKYIKDALSAPAGIEIHKATTES